MLLVVPRFCAQHTLSCPFFFFTVFVLSLFATVLCFPFLAEEVESSSLIDNHSFHFVFPVTVMIFCALFWIFALDAFVLGTCVMLDICTEVSLLTLTSCPS